MIRTALTLLLLSLAACGGGDPQGKSTTKLDAVEVQPGTISDSMIILDNATGDGTAVDNRIPDDGTAKAAPADEESKSVDGEEDAEADGENPDVEPAPALKKAVIEEE